MRFSSVASLALALVGLAESACENPVQRKEWRQLSTPEKTAYITAVKCLHEKLPAITSDTTGAVSRFDDFIGVHKVQTPNIHFVGHFLPWHRYFMWAYEQTLRTECGYTGGQPYWDYTIDSVSSQAFTNSPVWDADTGFGGDGSGQGNCVRTGPFKDWVIHLPSGTNTRRQDRCLSRQRSAQIATQNLIKSNEADVKSKRDFGWMSLALEGDTQGGMGIHGGGHFAIGGSAGDVYTSNTEPLFYLHHTNMDRIWAQWQAADPSKRNMDISLTIKPRSAFLNPAPTPAGNVTLDFQINLGKLGKAVTMRDVLDTQSGINCYVYV